MRACLILLACLAAPARAALPTPLEFGIAVEAGNTLAVKKWLDEGLSPDFIADRIGTGLMIAAWTGDLPMMRLFLERRADINLRNRFGEQALQLAAWRGHGGAVRLLLEQGARVNRRGAQWSALHYAAFAGHEDIARLLIEQGADVDARAPNGTTALMLAAREGQAGIAAWLLAAGADAGIANEWGDDALAFAMRNRNHAIARMVSDAEAFAAAAKQADTRAAPQRSVPAPQEIRELAERLQRARDEGRPTQALSQSLEAAYQRLRREKGGEAAIAAPMLLLIRADPARPGRERAELLLLDDHGGTVRSSPLRAQDRAQDAAGIGGILERLNAAQGGKGGKRSRRAAAELRQELRSAVETFKQGTEAEALR